MMRRAFRWHASLLSPQGFGSNGRRAPPSVPPDLASLSCSLKISTSFKRLLCSCNKVGSGSKARVLPSQRFHDRKSCGQHRGLSLDL